MSSSISLPHAVTSGDESAVKALLARGAEVNERTSGGQTALILAVIFGHTKLVELLIRAGADPHLRDNLGLDAIEWAQRRGLTEALALLTNTPQTKKVFVKTDEPQKPRAEPAPKNDENKPTVSEEEKSRRWVAGLKQRLHEQELRRLNRNEFPAEPPPLIERKPPPPPRVEPEPQPPRLEIEPPPRVERVPPPPVRVAVEATPAVKTISAPEPEPPKETKPAPPSKGTRKRCPQCNATYNSDLVFYCAHHIVPLVDADAPIISSPPKENPPLFWIMIIITLAGSIVVGSLVTTYLYKTNQASARNAAQQPNIQKGSPELGGDLVGKSIQLPDAECPVKGPEPVSGTVTVRVMVDRKGQVYWARGSGGDWLMRGAATEAAMKSTFSPEKLRSRETEGIITYTFKP